jgi:hypothetical protein
MKKAQWVGKPKSAKVAGMGVERQAVRRTTWSGWVEFGDAGYGTNLS